MEPQHSKSAGSGAIETGTGEDAQENNGTESRGVLLPLAVNNYILNCWNWQWRSPPAALPVGTCPSILPTGWVHVAYLKIDPH